MIEKPLAEFNMSRRQCRNCLKLKRIASKVPAVITLPVIPDVKETIQDPLPGSEDSDE
jgi:hypothetical protein